MHYFYYVRHVLIHCMSLYVFFYFYFLSLFEYTFVLRVRFYIK